MKSEKKKTVTAWWTVAANERERKQEEKRWRELRRELHILEKRKAPAMDRKGRTG